MQSMWHNNNISNVKCFYWHTQKQPLPLPLIWLLWSLIESPFFPRTLTTIDNFNANYFSSSFVNSHTAPGLTLLLIPNFAQHSSWLQSTHCHISNGLNFIQCFTVGYSLLCLRFNTCCFTIAGNLLSSAKTSCTMFYLQLLSIMWPLSLSSTQCFASRLLVTSHATIMLSVLSYAVIDSYFPISCVLCLFP